MKSHKFPLSLKFITGFFFILLICWAAVEYNDHLYRKNDGFSKEAVQFTIPFKKDLEIAPLTAEENNTLTSILNQKFFYLSKGARSFAFASEDGEYVIKFFKFRYEKPHWTVRYLPEVQPFDFFRQKKINKVSLDTVLTGYKIAYDKDPDGTGVIFIHLNVTPGNLPQITVVDKEGKSYLIALDDTRFVVQKKVKELGTLLRELLDKGDVAHAKEMISKTLDLYVSHYEKGIYDLGLGLIRNNGFIGERPVHFDTGKMTLNEKIKDLDFQYSVMLRLGLNGDKWLLSNFPQYRDEIRKAMEEKIEKIYSLKTKHL